MLRHPVCSGAVIAAILVTAAACGSARKPVLLGPVDTGTGSIAAARKYLEGRWALTSFELRPPGKPPVMVKAAGVLNYDEFGNLRMEIRADQSTADLLRASGVDTLDGVISTEGRAAVDMTRRTLTYFVAGQPASGNGPLAMNRPRYWEVTADVLTLTTRDDSGAPMSISQWKRAQ